MSIVLFRYSKTVFPLTSNYSGLLVTSNFSRYYHASHKHYNKKDSKKLADKIENKFPVVKDAKDKLSFYQTKYRKVNRYVFSKFFDYIKNYNQIFEQRFPRTFKAYRYFMDGVNNFFYDMKDYLMIVRKITGPGVHVSDLTRRDMEIYYYMPREMRKAAPTLILASMPGLFYAILPLAYMFPGAFLTHHFWTDAEKVTYRKRDILNRLRQHRPIFRSLQYELDKFKGNPLHETCSTALGMLGSGVHPSMEIILQMKELFRDDSEPFSLTKLSSTHVAYLLRLHMLHYGFNRRKRLEKFAWILLQMDKAIIREGGVTTIPADELHVCCYMRGLNTSEMKEDEMRLWLAQWVQITTAIADKSLASLILHCPILLSYNHPSNWSLLHPSRNK